ncbi:hypothetical protein GCM10028791_43950 [Echinicola sediminis]
MTEVELAENLALHENAYFFTKIKEGLLSNSLIQTTFKEVSSEKVGNFLLRVVKKESRVNEIDIEYSICVFKYHNKPTFIVNEVKGWEEIKLAYIVIIDFGRHLVISKRNVSGIDELNQKILPLDYKTISSVFIDDTTAFEKFSMNNMNISDNVVRSTSIEAINLKESISTLGLQSYILNNLRLNNQENKISLSLGSSRINKFGKKNNLDFFIRWSASMVSKIEKFVPSDNFLNSSATPLDFQKEQNDLKPIAILLLLTKLNSE